MDNRFNLIETKISDLYLLERVLINDSRGYFERLFCVSELAFILKGRSICQINHTLTHKKGTIRGMHFQNPPHTDMKLISCLKGSVFDVAIDLRPLSKTYLNWYAAILDENNHSTLVIPEGFAHGFQTLTDNCELIYLHTNNYNKESDSCINALDKKINVHWPLPITEMSIKDKEAPSITNQFKGLVL